MQLDKQGEFCDGAIRCFVAENKDKAGTAVAEYIVSKINEKQNKNDKTFVLGLATGSTPIPIYKELARLFNEKKILFSNVITINLDEYYPMQEDDINSYHYFMNENLFKFVDFKKENNFIPSGTIPSSDIQSHCEEYEKRINTLGIDIQLLGIGRSGHIGFNEPGSTIDTETRVVPLHPKTRSDAAEAFNGEENVPQLAITMGISSIMKAKECILCAWGTGKQDILQKSLTSEPSSDIPATFLQKHKNVIVVTDKDAAPSFNK